MTERLYYTDPMRVAFSATVVSCEPAGDGYMAVLDRTAFYPTSGGQPFDTGALGGARVTDVVDLEDGRIGHLIDRRLDPGAAVDGAVDWARRFDHMQQHTGQHILSAAFDRLSRARTVGFHMGEAVSSLDLDVPVSAEAIAAAEADANRVVFEDRPVTIRFATPEEAAGLQLRKDPVKTGPLRIIDVDGYDRSACGGTHVLSSARVGLVAVRSWERLRGGARLEFVCGGRALAAWGALRDTVAGSIRVLSVAPGELPAAIERVQGENKALQKIVRGLQGDLAGHVAVAVADRAEAAGAIRVAVDALDGWDQAGLKLVASAAVAAPGLVVCLLSAVEPRAAVIARSADVSVDAGALLKALVARLGGKGGGKPDLAQGGGLTGSVDDIRAAVLSAIAAV